MVWRWHGIPHVYCYYLCLEPTVRKDTWMRTWIYNNYMMRTTSVTVMEIAVKVAFWNLFDHSNVQSPFSTITRQIDNNTLKDTLQSYFLETWINMHAKSFIKTSVNATETKSDEGEWKKTSCAKIRACTWKNIGPK